MLYAGFIFVMLNAMTYLLRICAVLALIGCCLPSFADGDLSADLKSGDFFKMLLPDFQKKYLTGERMSWVDPEKTTMRISSPKIKIGAHDLEETIIKWKENKPSFMQIMLYNKGDDGAVNEETFDNRIVLAQEALVTAMGAPSTPYKPKSKESAVKIKAWRWTIPGGILSLEASSSGSKSRKDFEAEFIRLRVIPEGAANGNPDRAQRGDLKANVKRVGKRVVIEGIPMVDQGEKGYCAVATAARVFSYYGSEHVDQHELASAADTDAGGGTSFSDMKDAIKKIGSKFQVKVRQIDAFEDIADYTKLIKAYNREARKNDKPKMSEDPSQIVDIWEKADPDVLRKVRAGKPADVEKWMKPVRAWINVGVPILWSLELGIVPEPMRGSQSRGGHMRLIIGYDDETQMILFSDSWGAQHVCKEMPMADAAAVSKGRCILIPSR